MSRPPRGKDQSVNPVKGKSTKNKRESEKWQK